MWWDSILGDGAFTYTHGEVSVYHGGQQTLIDRHNTTAFMDSVSVMFRQAADVTTPARMFVLFVYTPSLNGVFVYKLLLESSLAGGLIATRKLQVINMEMDHRSAFSMYTFCIVLACICFCMEIRRILGCPKRCTFEHKTDHCSCWTFIFLLVPIAMLISFTVFTARFVSSTDMGMELDPVTDSLTQASVESLYQHEVLDYYNRLINLAVLLLLNSLLFRYLLMYFPQLSFLTAMVGKLVKPLWYTLVLTIVAFLVFAIFLYVMYSAQHEQFRSFILSFAMALKFAQGGISDWYDLYSEYATLYTIVILIGFVVIQLMLSFMPLAVMLSHKKEKDLRQNYSYHRFWAAEISKMGKSRGEFNPATFDKERER